jgi:hypothetical protein
VYEDEEDEDEDLRTKTDPVSETRYFLVLEKLMMAKVQNRSSFEQKYHSTQAHFSAYFSCVIDLFCFMH